MIDIEHIVNYLEQQGVQVRVCEGRLILLQDIAPELRVQVGWALSLAEVRRRRDPETVFQEAQEYIELLRNTANAYLSQATQKTRAPASSAVLPQ